MEPNKPTFDEGALFFDEKALSPSPESNNPLLDEEAFSQVLQRSSSEERLGLRAAYDAVQALLSGAIPLDQFVLDPENATMRRIHDNYDHDPDHPFCACDDPT